MHPGISNDAVQSADAVPSTVQFAAPSIVISEDRSPVLLWSSSGCRHAMQEGPTEPVPCEPRDGIAITIPRVVWTYWHGEPLPLIVHACLASWRRHLPAYSIRLLELGSLPPSLSPLPSGFATWPAQVQSDWIRLAVLATYGGIWMDATTLLTGVPCATAPPEDTVRPSPLSFVETLYAQHRSDLIGYFNQERTHDSHYPMLENWFLAAPPQSPFVLHWWKTFDAMLSPDGRGDARRVVTELTLPVLLQGFSHAPEYFACHGAAQCVMRRYGGQLSLIPAELDAFFEPHSRGWDPERVCAWLCDVAADGTRPSARPLTKLIGLLWRPLEDRLRGGEVHPESILGELCDRFVVI